MGILRNLKLEENYTQSSCSSSKMKHLLVFWILLMFSVANSTASRTKATKPTSTSGTRITGGSIPKVRKEDLSVAAGQKGGSKPGKRFRATQAQATQAKCDDWQCMGQKIAHEINELQNRVLALEEQVNQQQQNEIEALNALTGIHGGAQGGAHLLPRNKIRPKKSATLRSLMKSFGLS